MTIFLTLIALLWVMGIALLVWDMIMMKKEALEFLDMILHDEEEDDGQSDRV